MRTSGAAGLALLALVGCLTGCAGEGGGGKQASKPTCTPQVDPSTISFASNIQPIYTRSCAVGGCHDGATRAQNLDLSTGAAYSQTVKRRSTQQNLNLILPGKPDDSYLIRKIEGGPNITGVLMPQDCPATPRNGAICLSPDDIQAVRTWVLACAPQN
jgi:hypothetical protein